MRTETTVTFISCDRCGKGGNPEFPHYTKRRFFSPTLQTNDYVPSTGPFRGWFLGRKWHYCPACTLIENKQSQAGRSKVINLNEQREAV